MSVNPPGKWVRTGRGARFVLDEPARIPIEAWLKQLAALHGSEERLQLMLKQLDAVRVIHDEYTTEVKR